MKRFPRRGIVSMKRGLSAESPKTTRSFRMAVLMPSSKLTKVSAGHRLACNSSRVIISPGRSSSIARTRKGCSCSGTLLHQVLVASLQFGKVLEGSIAPVPLVPPEMALHGQAQSAKFAQHRSAAGHHRIHARSGILVHVLHVAVAAVFPSARRVHQA